MCSSDLSSFELSIQEENRRNLAQSFGVGPSAISREVRELTARTGVSRANYAQVFYFEEPAPSESESNG